MGDPAIVRANERYRALANVPFTLGTALIAASVVQGYQAKPVSLEVVGWSLAAAVLMWVGWKVLGLLDAAD